MSTLCSNMICHEGKCELSLNGEPSVSPTDDELQRMCVRKYLARQPTLPFKRTKKLLASSQPKKGIDHGRRPPPKPIAAATTGPPLGNRRKRDACPRRVQPGMQLFILSASWRQLQCSQLSLRSLARGWGLLTLT